MPPEDAEVEEAHLFINAEPFVRSVQWRIGVSSLTGALTTEQITDLASRFEIGADALKRLSWRLELVLEPLQHPNLVAVDSRKARKQGDDRLMETLNRLGRADDLLEDSSRALQELYIDPRSDPENAEALGRVRKRLGLVIYRLGQVHCALEAIQRSSSPMVLAPWDKRAIRDQRRGPVLNAIFKTWKDHGPPRSYTSDPGTGERSGPLLDFVKAVTAYLTDPSTPVPQDTVVKEYGRWLRWQNDDQGAAEFQAFYEQWRQERAERAAAPDAGEDIDRDAD
ncbi:hypothetical protein H5395_14420 [Paracoccus sp. MC1854]|uniref:hypothetical protein n=1 Tax=Paracoccus sp. MC1854 TaxID=2760306 RepID=UPI00160141F8|nr:hypothetical protein [Paracoccus sp. MC1854]MBB1492704.1 hypothetical protein [Paracoccus sp. MC1854]